MAACDGGLWRLSSRMALRRGLTHGPALLLTAKRSRERGIPFEEIYASTTTAACDLILRTGRRRAADLINGIRSTATKSFTRSKSVPTAVIVKATGASAMYCALTLAVGGPRASRRRAVRGRRAECDAGPQRDRSELAPSGMSIYALACPVSRHVGAVDWPRPRHHAKPRNFPQRTRKPAPWRAPSP